MTDPLLALPEPDRAALEDHLSRLRHDLGKYVSLQVRWLGDGATGPDLAEALTADLLSTRRGPDGSVAAHAVWADFRPALVGAQPLPSEGRVDLTEDADFAALDAAMSVVEDVAADLARGKPRGEVVERGVEAARTVSTLCRKLWTRVRGG